MANETYKTFEDVKARLDQIVDAVSDENLPLDEALALYEEAVGLGLRASDLLEEHIEETQADEASTEQTEVEVAKAGEVQVVEGSQTSEPHVVQAEVATGETAEEALPSSSEAAE